MGQSAADAFGDPPSHELTEQKVSCEQRLAKSVVIDEEKQAELASVCQAIGVSLSACWLLLDVLIPGQQSSVPTLGRRTQAAGKRAGELLAVLDEQTSCPRIGPTWTTSDVCAKGLP